MRIALAQSQVISAQSGPYTSGDDPFDTLRTNLNNASKDIQQAKSEGADIVCFPEYFLQGILNDGRQYLGLPAKYLEERLQDLAEEHEIAITGTIVYGSSDSLPPFPTVNPFPSPSIGHSSGEVVSDHPGFSQWRTYLDETRDCLADTSHFTLLNQAIYIDSRGKTAGRYTKRNLWHPERALGITVILPAVTDGRGEYLEPGTEEHPVFDTPWGKAGFLICWDLSHPAAAQTLADKGADIIFAPAYWLLTDSEPTLSRHNPHPHSYEPQIVSALCSARAFETETVLIHTNPGGKSSEDFMGGSTVYAPLMGKMGGWDVGNGSVGIRIVDVDLGVLKDARETYKIREDAAIRDAT